MKALFKCHVTDAGKLIFIDKARWMKTLGQLITKDVGVSIAPWSEVAQRSNQQNRYLHKLFQIIGNEIGLNVEDTKHSIKRHLKFYDLVTCMDFDKKEKVTRKQLRSTASLSKKEFIDFKIQLQQFAAEMLGIDLPDPNECI